MGLSMDVPAAYLQGVRQHFSSSTIGSMAGDQDERAALIVDQWGGIFAAYEAFYIRSILYTADRCLDSFDLYERLRAEAAAGHDQVSAIHEAMGHAAALSRFFWPSGLGARRNSHLERLKQARASKLRAAFAMTDQSPLRDRSLRDALEHFDERLDVYLLTSDAGRYMPIPRVGDATGLPNGVDHVFKLVDPGKSVFVILDRRFDFGSVRDEVRCIFDAAKQMSENGDRLPRTE